MSYPSTALDTFTFELVLDELSEKYYQKSQLQFHDGDSGLDLYVPEDIEIPPNKIVKINLHVKARGYFTYEVRYPGGGCMRQKYHGYWMCARSSNVKKGLMLVNSIGVIDKDYTGDLQAAFYNCTAETVHVKAGDRLVQLVGPAHNPLAYKIVESHAKTTRGEGGFGSTG